MKKQIFIGALALITLAACQNEREDITQDNSEIAVQMVKNDAKGQSSRAGIPKDESLEPPGPNDAVISCHTDYAYPTGNSCVWVNGMQFRVTWTTVYVANTSSASYPEKIYEAKQVSFCGC
ncbi:hypothetical protein OWR28_02455 [Chryseobacterium sp. 1B4]